MLYVLDDIVDVEVEAIVATPITIEAIVELPVLVVRITQDNTNE